MVNAESPDAPATSDSLIDSLLALDTSDEPRPEDTPADAPADPTPDPTDAVQVDATEDAPAPAAVTPEPPADAAASPDAPSDAPPAPLPASEPFTFTVDGTKVDVPGARIQGDEIILTKDAFARAIQPRLADRGAWQKERQTLLADAKAAREHVSTEQAQAKVVLQKLAALVEEPDEIARWEALEDMRAKLPLHLRDAEIAALKSRTTQVESKEQDESRSRAQAELEAAKPANIAAHLDHLLAQPDYDALKSDRQRVLELLVDNADKLYVATGEPDPVTGIPPLAFNYEFAAKQLGREAKYAADRAKQYQTVQAAAALNASKTSRPAPPSVPASGTPTGTQKVNPIKTKADFEKLIDSLAAGED